jgi:hypothetical protein
MLMNTTFLFWEQGKTCNKVVIKNYCINSTHLLLLPLLWSDSLTDPLQTRGEVRGGGVGVLPLTFYNFLFCFSFFLVLFLFPIYSKIQFLYSYVFTGTPYFFSPLYPFLESLPFIYQKEASVFTRVIYLSLILCYAL